MTEYRWKGIDQKGSSQKGIMAAASPESLRQQLQDQGIALLWHRQSYLKKIMHYRIGTRKIYSKDLALFFQHISILLEHGITLVKALQTCVLQSKSTELKKLITTIIPSIQHGRSFAQALEEHAPDIPSHLQFLLIIGEQTGSLASMCKNLGNHLHSTQELKSKIKQTLLVPTVTGIFALVVTLLILLFIVPHFQELFKTSHLELPAITQRIFFLSSLLKSPWALVLLSFPILCLTLIRNHVKQLGYSLGLKMPYIKNILLSMISLTFLETLSLYVRAGLPLSQGLEQTQSLATCTQINRAIQSISMLVLQGNSLEYALEQSPIALCSPTVISLIGVGERAGNLDLMLEKSVTWQHSELTKKLDLISSLASPVLMIVLGCLITALLVTIYLPIFNMALVPLA